MRTIDADALREAVESHVTSVSVCATAEQARGRTDFKKLCLKDIDEAPTVGGWVSVEDRLPEDERFVLVCNDDGKMMVAQYIAETDKWQYRYMAYDVDVWDDTEQGPVEWWMPLPEAPKEG